MTVGLVKTAAKTRMVAWRADSIITNPSGATKCNPSDWANNSLLSGFNSIPRSYTWNGTTLWYSNQELFYAMPIRSRPYGPKVPKKITEEDKYLTTTIPKDAHVNFWHVFIAKLMKGVNREPTGKWTKQ